MIEKIWVCNNQQTFLFFTLLSGNTHQVQWQMGTERCLKEMVLQESHISTVSKYFSIGKYSYEMTVAIAMVHRLITLRDNIVVWQPQCRAVIERKWEKYRTDNGNKTRGSGNNKNCYYAENTTTAGDSVWV